MSARNPCLSDDQLRALLTGAQDPDLPEWELHLSECAECRGRLAALAGGESLPRAQRLRSTTPISPALREAMERLKGPEPFLQAMEQLQVPDAPDLGGKEGLTELFGRKIRHLGDYEIIEELGRGGMGIVLKARDKALSRVVALKVLPPRLGAQGQARTRFVREARAAAAVVHEHVVPIYAVDEREGLPFLVMQFIKGRSLAARLKATGPLRLEEILRIGAQTAAGLAAAHAQGLIHRDVKPDNILLENSVERVKLTDFGLARALDDTELTRPGEVPGTPEYMSPEQAQGETLDARSDLFSLGSVLYAMASGVSPFTGGSPLAVLRKVCDAKPRPLRELTPGLPEYFCQTVERLMAKKPADRFQSAQEVAALLGRGLARLQQGAEMEPRVSWPAASVRGIRQHRGKIAVVAALALAAIALIAFWPERKPSVPSFLVRDSSGKVIGKFPALEAAIKSSAPGAAIELAVNGPIEVEALVIDHPLILRAAVGSRPVLVRRDAADPMLLVRSPLVIEGLTLRDTEVVAQARDLPPRDRMPGGPRGPDTLTKELIRVEHTTVLLANCRLMVLGPAGPGLPTIQLAGRARCEIQNCELFAPDSAAVNVRPAFPGGDTSRFAIALRNCVCFAQRAFIGGPVEGTIDLGRNTFVGDAVFNWNILPLRHLGITSTSNLFDLERMMNRGLPVRVNLPTPPPAGRASETISWREQGNFYAVQRFSIISLSGQQIEPELKDLAAWLEYWRATGPARFGKAQVWSRVRALQTNPEKLMTKDFRLEGTRAQDGGAVDGVGADLDLVGPGAAYDRWRGTDSYAEWTRLVGAVLPPP